MGSSRWVPETWRRSLLPLGRIAGVFVFGLSMPLLVLLWVNLTAPSLVFRPSVVALGSSVVADAWPVHSTPEERFAHLERDPSVALGMAILGLPDAPVWLVDKWSPIARLYLGDVADEADGLTLPWSGHIYLRSEMFRDYEMSVVRGILLHELVHAMEMRAGRSIGRAWRANGVAPIRDPDQYGFRNVFEQRAEAGEAALAAILALERGMPPEQMRRYLAERERMVPGTILMFRWMLSQPALEGRPWRRVTFFAEVPPLPAPWPSLRPEAVERWQ